MEIYDAILDPVELTGIARENLADEDLPENQFLLERWFGNNLVDDVEVAFNGRTNRDFTHAMRFRAWTTEAPIGRRYGRTRRFGELAPLTEKYPMTEYDRVRQRRRARNEAVEAAREETYDDIATGVRAARARMELLRADALVYGSATLAEGGLQLDADFLRSVNREGTVSNAWSDATNGTPLTDEEGVLDVLSDEEGLGPADLIAIMNRNTYRNLRASDQYRNGLDRVNAPVRLTNDQINEVREDNDFPEVIVYNASARTHGGTVRKLIPDDFVIHVPRNARIGETAWGVSAYATEDGLNLEASFQPGPVAFHARQLDPLVIWTVVDGIGFAVLQDPDATHSLDVS